MSKEKEAYKMTSGNEAPDSSGPRFKSSSKRRIYIVIGVVCLLIVVAVAVALGVYFGTRGCQMDKITLTVKSSDCNTSVAAVSITSSAELTITEMGPGVYVGEVCGMPATLSLQKEGFEPLTRTVTGAAETVTMTCSEPNCTVHTATISVTSTCATSNVEGVTIRGQNVIDVTSSAPGSYQIKVCSQPTLVDFERTGYASQQTVISDGSTVTLLCDSPIIITDPQSKYRSEGDSLKLCCQTEPAVGVTYKWYKDGTELASETNNELSLTSLESNNQGQYQCYAKLTADPNLPAVRSREAMLTIRAAASDDCADAWRPNRMEVFPGCYYDVGQCLKRSCRSSGSGESCLDNNVCCENTRTVSPGCAMGNLVTQVFKCSCRCSAPSVLTITGTVKNSITDLPITGIVITFVGTTFNTTTNASGEFSFSSVPSQRRRIVAKASDPSGMYLDAYVIKTIPGSEILYQVLMNIAMTRKAPFTEIDPVVENRLSISGDPSAQNNGSPYLKVPANAFYNTDWTQYTGKVSLSLTYIDPSERLEDAPGEFVTLNSDGRSEILVTLGVFSIDFEDDSGNKLLLKNNIEVYTKQSTPYLLWQLDEQTGTWVLINTLTRRKKRQAAQERLIGSFTPKTGKWYNIDYKLAEPDCFFKIRVFQSNFSELNEITNSRKVIPKVRQILSIGDGNGVKYSHSESLAGCFQIQCPTELAKASISVTHLIHYEDTPFRQVGSLPVPFRHVDKPLAPATVGDYSTAIKSILQSSQYNYYTLPALNTHHLYVNTQMAETGPFYPDIDRCEASTFDDPAFWFAEPPAFVEGDFYDGTEDRCVGRLSFYVSSVSDPDLLNNLKVAEIEVDVMSIWSDNTYGVKAASIKVTSPLSPPQDGSWYWISGVSCFEYRCSTENAMTSVYFAISNNTLISCSRSNVPPSPVLDSSEKEEGYYFNGMSNVEEALVRCNKDTENFVGYLNCGQRYF